MPIKTRDILDLIELPAVGLEDYIVVADVPTLAGAEPVLKKILVRRLIEAASSNRWHVTAGAPGSKTGAEGDLAFDRTTGMIYEKGNAGWAAVGTIRGPKGEPGEQGAVGPAGPSPAVRWTGTKLEIQNPDGSWQDPVDLAGPPGRDGALWLGDERDPLQGEGRNGDHWLNLVTGDIFRKGGDAWSHIANIHGSKWYTGRGVPTKEGPGTKHDYYLDLETALVWYRNPQSGEWESTGLSLHAAQTYVGSGPPPDELGVDGDAYFDTAAGTIYKKTPQEDGSAAWEGPYLFSPPLLAENVSYAHAQFPDLGSVGEALDQLFAEVYYVAPEITSLTSDKDSVYEVGQVVSDVLLSWEINKPVTSLSLTDAPELTPEDRERLFPGPYASTKTWTLTVGDGKQSASRSLTIAFRHRRHWGTSPDPALTDLSLLGSSEFATSRQQTRTFDGGGEYLYFAYPAAWGAASFKVNGLDNTAWTETIIEHTNASGHTESYRVYRTNTVQNGTGISVQLL